MNKSVIAYWLIALLVAGSTAEFTCAEEASPAMQALKQQVHLFAKQSRGVMGISVKLLGTDRGFAIAGDESFPMASTYKVPIAAYAFHLIDRGKLSLEQMVPVLPHQVSLPGQPIATYFPHAGISFSLYNLIEVMLTQSDNTATDVVLTLVGGGKKVTQWLKDNGINDLRVDRTTVTLFREFMGVPTPTDKQITISSQFEQLFGGLGDELEAEFDTGYANFLLDPQDHSTPDAMTRLLEKIWAGKLLSADSTDKIKSIMVRCETGPQRLKGLLPAGTVVAHKTGTIVESLNDVGVITLPGGRGEVVISVFIKNSKHKNWAPREKAIAQVARAVHDYFLFTTP